MSEKKPKSQQKIIPKKKYYTRRSEHFIDSEISRKFFPNRSESKSRRAGVKWIQIVGKMQGACGKRDRMSKADSLKFPTRNGAYVERHLGMQFRTNESSKLWYSTAVST